MKGDGPRVSRLPAKAGNELVVLSVPVSLDGVEGLTDAEREVLELILAGYGNKAIAEVRDTAERTVANQIAALLHKLGLGSRGELAVWAADRLNARDRGA